MSSTINNGIQGLATVSGAAAKYLPEPAVSGVGAFNDVMNVMKSVGEAAIGGVSTVATGDFSSLLSKQIEIQKEMQTTAMVSNIEKSNHETKMAPIRNIRVS